ncbi:hypothetical protein P886_3393 [Alteromonadaceae bacterium 2753L.S.0a.02]|nr:hypothetical protein P886_3393 [Alteromonadaceae bacterium 2753L.S.0a.02]
MKTALFPRTASLLTAVIVASTLSGSGLADTLAMPQGSNYNESTGAEKWNLPIPRKGMSKADVEAGFGTPVSKNGPTGEPPIYFWEYEAFTVYFESDYVIHTVRKYKP